MFFRNTGGIVNASAASETPNHRARASQRGPVRQVDSIQTECLEHTSGLGSGDINDTTILEQPHEQFQVRDDAVVNPIWTGWIEPNSVQDDLDWFFEPGQSSHDLVDSAISHFDIGLLMNTDLPTQYRSENISTEYMLEGDKVDTCPDTSQEDEWLIARSNILDALSQLDTRILHSPFFDVDNLKMFHALYLTHYHPHFPIVHQPTLSITSCEPLLLAAILDLGSTIVHDETLFLLGQQVHNSLRHIIINSGMFEPPIPLWCLQALLLVQAYGKMISSRKNYEMAHIFHGAILTMMKRGSAYLAASTPRPPQPTDSVQQIWFRWVSEESWRRTAFFAFIMDAQHACVFGHSPVLSVSDMQMALPCQESLWECTSPDGWQELKEAHQAAPTNCSSSTENTSSAVTFFLPALKSMIRGNLVPPSCSEYARFILLHGLMSLQTHLHAGSRLTLGIEAGKFQPRDAVGLMDGGGGGGGGATSGSETLVKPWAAIITSAIDSWSTCLFSLQPSVCLEAARPLHRIAHITLHASVVDIHTMAMDRDRLDGTLARNNYDKTRARIQRWCFSNSAREAFRHALLLVQETMFSGQLYRARDDNIAPRPWCLYIAVLTLWVFGVITEGELPHDVIKANAEDYVIRMTSALQRGLKSPIGANQTAGLIRAARDALSGCRWELLQEANNVLGRLAGDASGNDPVVAPNKMLI
ncbi:fungal-specific transcription factor domain-containing protein [Aspergillus granulosus]|uniref:Fungal-specific transcription factor domain-containing protein n=1 Tax=Aspergillus granulosus TaxID=176169 RepID=A0ABR4HXU2_9EURO